MNNSSTSHHYRTRISNTSSIQPSNQPTGLAVSQPTLQYHHNQLSAAERTTWVVLSLVVRVVDAVVDFATRCRQTIRQYAIVVTFVVDDRMNCIECKICIQIELRCRPTFVWRDIERYEHQYQLIPTTENGMEVN